MTSITLNFPDMDTLTALLTIFATVWTIYQEYRHKHNNGTIKPQKSVVSIKNDIDYIKNSLHNALPHFKK